MKSRKLVASLVALVCVPCLAQAYQQEPAGGLSGEHSLKNTRGGRRVVTGQKLGQSNKLSGNQSAAPGTAPGLAAPEKIREDIPAPARAAAIDRGQFRAGPDFQMPTTAFKVLETPHFKIMYERGLPPNDLAELAERMWHDAAFFYGSFAQKFATRKYSIFAVESDVTYRKLGEWYADFLEKSGQGESANYVRTAWNDSAAISIGLPSDMAVSNGVMRQARIYNMARPGTGQGGVWVPFRVHSMAEDLLKVEFESMKDWNAPGFYALSTGYAFFKEIFYTGAAETGIIGMESVAAVNTSGGFAGDARTWPEQLRRLVIKGDIKPSLAALYEMTDGNAAPARNVLAYSFVRFIHTTPERIGKWSNLFDTISETGVMPAAADLATQLGFKDTAWLETEWAAYIRSSRFR